MGLDVEDIAHALVEEEIEHYFTAVLPAHIDADFRGNGYEMLYRMLDAHDRRDLARSPTPPSPRARAMAARVRAQCPPIISDAVLAEGGQVVLGRFSQDTRIVGSAIRSKRRVEIFARAMKYATATTVDELRAEIALTIFHEYIHYFESFLLLREQPLRGREVGAPVAMLDLAEARRRDLRHTRTRIAKITAAAALAVTVVVATVIATRPPTRSQPSHPAPMSEADRQARRESAARESAALAAQDRALLAHVDEIVARDLGPQDAVALVGLAPTVAFAPGHESRLVASSQLVPDPRFPGAPAGVPDAALTYLWSHDRDTDPPRLVGIAWSADGHPVRIAATIAVR